MAATILKNYLRRYTNLPSLLYLLRERKITLLDPQTWDDKNDSFYLSSFRDKKSLKSVLALCFSQVPETYHHWRVLARRSGVAKRTIARLEQKMSVPYDRTLRDLQACLEEMGVEFLFDGATGVGIRLRQAKEIQTAKTQKKK